MISRILIAVEDLYFIDAIETFIAQIETTGKGPDLKILHVIDPKEAVYAWPSDEYRKEAETLLASITDRLSKRFPNLHVEGLLREGYVKEEIVEEAKLWSADLILMGPHGRKGIGKLLLGSVAKAVVPLAPCSVVLLRAFKDKISVATSSFADTQESPM
ncbi:MAG: universal stress protein [Candidatus Melainabacteria bacterium]|nr:universal stress protein [Candidatus Melainabacteria bacterium]